MFRRIDQSQVLTRLLNWFSNFLAKQRGLPVVFAVVLIVIGFVVQLLALYVDSQALRVLAVVTHNLGVLIALIGLLLIVPLGK